MNNLDTTFIFVCDAVSVEQLRTTLEEQGAIIQASPRRQLDGASAASWIVAATVAMRTAPLVINALREFLTRNNVREIKVGDISIVNPRPEDTDRLLEAIRSRDNDG